VSAATSAPPVVAYERLPLADREATARALCSALAARSPDALALDLAHRLRLRGEEVLLEVEVPRFASFPSYEDLRRHAFEPWLREVERSVTEAGMPDLLERAWLAAEARLLPLDEAVTLVAGEASPLVDLERRRVEVEQRRAERRRAADEARAASDRDRAQDRAWEAQNAERTRRFRELPNLLQALAVAAEGDPHLERFVAKAIEIAGSRGVTPRVPEFLWRGLRS
jgi:hypothetical protein